ncbi:MAG: hypothetical protein JSS61_03485 [Verrucomicrobia bacterium]|nr:hypothetical protein [Verrucomicrobiota bacterium]
MNIKELNPASNGMQAPNFLSTTRGKFTVGVAVTGVVLAVATLAALAIPAIGFKIALALAIGAAVLCVVAYSSSSGAKPRTQTSPIFKPWKPEGEPVRKDQITKSNGTYIIKDPTPEQNKWMHSLASHGFLDEILEAIFAKG